MRREECPAGLSCSAQAHQNGARRPRLAEVHKVGHKSSMTRQSFHTGVSLAALAALLVCGCFTREVLRTESHDPPDQFNALLDSMINDRRTWVDPPDGI